MQPTLLFLLPAFTGLAVAIPASATSRRGTSYLQAYEHADYKGFAVPQHSWPWVPWNKCFTLDKSRDNKYAALISFKIQWLID